MHDVIQSIASSYGLGRRRVVQSRWRRRLRAAIHFFSYHLILNRHTTRTTRAGGFRLSVGPTVFHPRYFLTSEFFASVIDRLDLNGKRVADVGTGSGILALAAVRAGAASVAAIDINPNAVLTTAGNSRANPFPNRLHTISSHLFPTVPPDHQSDV